MDLYALAVLICLPLGYWLGWRDGVAERNRPRAGGSDG
jgi:hypothetical protein